MTRPETEQEPTGIVRFVGWREADTEAGAPKRFMVEIEFPNGPPFLPFAAIWDEWPATLTVAPPSDAQGEG